jgi:hypothetical protein
MSAGVYTYASDEVRVVVGGVPMSGFADGTFVTIARDEQAFQKTTGADGSVSRAKTANRSGIITITLQQTSPSNDVLSGYMLADEASGDGIVPILIKDTSGRTLHFSPSAWVQQMPDNEFGKDVSEREWVMDCARIDSFVGGNTRKTGRDSED